MTTVFSEREIMKSLDEMNGRKFYKEGVTKAVKDLVNEHEWRFEGFTEGNKEGKIVRGDEVFIVEKKSYVTLGAKYGDIDQFYKILIIGRNEEDNTFYFERSERTTPKGKEIMQEYYGNCE
jgi:hypothetical protein